MMMMMMMNVDVGRRYVAEGVHLHVQNRSESDAVILGHIFTSEPE